MKAIVHPHTGSARGVEHHVKDMAEDADLDVVHVEDKEAFLNQLPSADIVFTFRWDEEYLEYADRLQWIQSLSAGCDHFPCEAFKQRNIRLTNASGVHPKPIAEHVYGYLLGIERGLFRTQSERTERVWDRSELQEMHGKTLGVIGVGAIGKEICRKANAFDLTVHGLDPYADKGFEHVDAWYEQDRFRDFLGSSDYMVIACPLTDETRHMFAADEFGAMKDSAILVNIGRGEIVVEDELIDALTSGTIRAAALDVFEEEPLPAGSPLWDLENCIITPHNSGRSPAYGKRLAEIFMENLEQFQRGERMPTEVYELEENMAAQ